MPITLNGDTGITTPGLINTGSTTLVNLTTTGNTVLGDQSTDTLNVANGNLVLNSSGNLGIGTASPASKLDVRGNSASTTVMVGAYVYNENTTTNSQAGLGFFSYDNFNAKIYTLRSGSSAGNIVFATNGGGGVGEANVAERARIDSSGNLGVGTASPSARLHAVVDGAGESDIARFSRTNGADLHFLDIGVNADTNFVIFDSSGSAAGGYTFRRGGTDAMTLDASGNLGVGTTSPSTFGVLAVKRDQTADTAITVSNAGTANAATSMSFVLNEAGTAQGWFRRYRDGSGNTEIGFSDSLLFTGNVSSTKTERARINSSGNLLVGDTTSAYSAKIYANGIIAARNGGVDGTFQNAFIAGYSSNYNELNAIQSAVSSVGTLSGWRFQASIGGGSGTTYKTLDSLRDVTIFYTQDTERARIDSNGNFGIGTTSPASRLDVNAKITLRNGGDSRLGYIQNSGGAVIIGSETSGTTELVFQTNGPTERARINSSGNFGVANTSPSYLVDVGSNSDGAYLRAQGGFLARKYTVSHNGTTGRTFRVTVALNGLQFTNFFMDASAHYFNNGGAWQAQRYAFQVMAEGGALRHNIRMPNYEYGGATSGVFTVGNPPSWTYVSDATWYFDFTVAGGFVSYITFSAAGPGIQNITLTVVS